MIWSPLLLSYTSKIHGGPELLVWTNSPLSPYVPTGLTEKVILDGHCPLYCNSSFFAILQHHIMGNGLDLDWDWDLDHTMENGLDL